MTSSIESGTDYLLGLHLVKLLKYNCEGSGNLKCGKAGIGDASNGVFWGGNSSVEEKSS